MSKTNAFETDWLELIFNNTAVANIGDAGGLRAAPTAGSLYIALYTESPTDSTNGTECAYGDYDRVAVTRASGAGGWTVSGNTADNTSAIQFPQASSGSESAVAVGIHTQDYPATTLIYYGDLDSNLSISSGVQPEFSAGDLDITES